VLKGIKEFAGTLLGAPEPHGFKFSAEMFNAADIHDSLAAGFFFKASAADRFQFRTHSLHDSS